MRLVIGAATALLVITLIAGGAYWVTNADREAELPATPAPAGAASAERGFAFGELATPRELPALRFVDGEGRETSLEEFQGKTILLNLWATWCVPCRKEMPALDRLQARLGGPDFQVVPLSIDREGLPTVKAFYEKLGLEALGIYVDSSGEASRQLGALGIPTTLLIDRNGRELGRMVGPAEWDSDEIVEFLRAVIVRGSGATLEEGEPVEQLVTSPAERDTPSHRTIRRGLTFQSLEGSM